MYWSFDFFLFIYFFMELANCQIINLNTLHVLHRNSLPGVQKIMIKPRSFWDFAPWSSAMRRFARCPLFITLRFFPNPFSCHNNSFKWKKVSWFMPMIPHLGSYYGQCVSKATVLKFSLRLIGSAMFDATFKRIKSVAMPYFLEHWEMIVFKLTVLH